MSGFIGRGGALSKLKPFKSGCGLIDRKIIRLRVVPHFSSGIVEAACRLFSRGVIFTRARVSLALYYP